MSLKNSPRSGAGMTTTSPPSASTGKHRTPAAWVSGASARYTGRPENGYDISVSADIVSRLRPVSRTPLGRPVVPPVPTSIATSSGGSTSSASAGSAPSHSSSEGSSVLESRHTSVRSAGSESRIFDTNGPNAEA